MDVSKAIDSLLENLNNKFDALSRRVANLEAVESPSGSSAPVDAKYIVQTPDGTLTNEQALSLLTTGIVKNTTGTGVLSIAVAGTDYSAPGHTHAESDVTNLVSDLALKAALVHTHSAAQISSGQLALARGGTGADLSATGPGYVKQASAGAVFTVGAIAQVDVPAFTGATAISAGTKGGVPAPAAGDQNKVLFGNATWGTPPSGINSGVATLDFGAFVAAPSENSYIEKNAMVTVTGQTSILAGSVIQAFIRAEPSGSADHSMDEHIIEDIRIVVANIVAGTGFDIYGECMLGGTYGQYDVQWIWF